MLKELLDFYKNFNKIFEILEKFKFNEIKFILINQKMLKRFNIHHFLLP